MSDLLEALLGTAVGIVSSSLFVLVLVIGFCVLVGPLKLQRTAGRGGVIRPSGPADRLRTPELLELAQRKS